MTPFIRNGTQIGYPSERKGLYARLKWVTKHYCTEAELRFEKGAFVVLEYLLGQLRLNFQNITPCLHLVRKNVESMPKGSHLRNLEACCAAAVVTHCKQTAIVLQMSDLKPLLRCSYQKFVKVYLYFNRNMQKTGKRKAIARLVHSSAIELPIKQTTKNYALVLVDTFPLIFTNTTAPVGAAAALSLACYLKDQMIKRQVSLTRIAQTYGVAVSAVSSRVNRWLQKQDPDFESIKTIEKSDWQALERSVARVLENS